ncbi:MAG: MmgE/PrpD family protein, partial [Roseiarcus sp.]
MKAMPPFPEQVLAQFAASLAYEAIPPAVVRRCEELMLDWFGSALAGNGVRPVEIVEKFAGAMGPGSGPSE